MTLLPDTDTKKGTNRRWPLYVLAAAGLIAISLSIETFLRTENFSSGEEIYIPGIKDISVSARDSLYPPPDTDRFAQRPETVFVYLSVEGLPSSESGMEARVQRTGSGSALSLLPGQEGGLEAVDEQEDQLRSTESGAAGVVKFALKTGTGDPVPPGNYTVDVYGPEGSDTSSEEDGGGAGRDVVAARKSFVVEG